MSLSKPGGAARRSAKDTKSASRATFESFVPKAEALLRPGKAFAAKKLSRRTRVLLVAPLAAASLLMTALIGIFIYYTVRFPDPLTLTARERAPIIRILARDGAVIAERGAAHDYMPLDLLPPLVTNAVVATEDRRFFSHWGLDPAGMVRAAFANLRAGRFTQGGSTLTQQLAKNLFLSPERTLSRKVEEFVLALWLELRLSKREILELYLNRVYFGGGAYGIESAAQRYFDKSARELTLAEAAVIAGLLKAPSRYAPSASTRLAIARGHSVLSKMRAAGFITTEQEIKARTQKLIFTDTKKSFGKDAADYAIDYVLERMPSILGSGHAEVIVDTTLDATLQRQASAIVAKALETHGAALAVSQAALAVLDTDGGIRALVGGKSYSESQFNRAVKARRQPGSTFKPFLYLTALESGFTPDSVAYDLPLTIDGWSPKNDSGKYSGPVTLRYALSHSINTIAVRLMLDVGPSRVAGLARRLGITSELREDHSLALGTSEVSLLELTGAYGVFATGGRGIEPHIVRRVRMNSGRILFARSAPQADQLASPAAIGAMNDMLSETLRSGTGQRAALAGHSAAGKTGTSQDFRDAWFVGYTAHLAGGVWIGNDDGKPMNRSTGGNLPAEIWRQVMTVAHEGKSPMALPGIELVPAAEPGAAVAALDGTSPPRSELLPWDMPERLAARPKSLPKSPAVKSAVAKRKPAAQSVHPVEPIDENFIARATGAAPGDDKASGPVAPSNGRIIVRPPAGIMSLGAGAQSSAQ